MSSGMTHSNSGYRYVELKVQIGKEQRLYYGDCIHLTTH